MAGAGLIECAECGAPAEETDRFTMGGTAIADMREIRCVAGHRYHTAEFIDEPHRHEWGCWGHARYCNCNGQTHIPCNAPAATDVGLCAFHHMEIVGA